MKKHGLVGTRKASIKVKREPGVKAGMRVEDCGKDPKNNS